jgi:short-subunit dehydrogenase
MTDKTVIVTGAARGIGLAIAKGFASRGWNVALNYRSDNGSQLEALDAVRAVAAPDVEVELFRADVSKAEECTAMVNAVIARFGGIRALINNAGFGKMGYVEELDPEDQGGMVDLNVRALTVLSAMVLPYMHKGAFVLNVCSIASFVPNPRMTVYSSTKASSANTVPSSTG